MLHSWFFLPLAAAMSLGANSCALFGPGCDSEDEDSAAGGRLVGPGFDVDSSVPGNDGTDGGGAICGSDQEGWRIDNTLELSVGKVPLDTIDTSFVTLGDEGCLKEVSFGFSLGGDLSCRIDLTAGPYKDSKGRLIVSYMTVSGSGPCPGWPSDLRSTIAILIRDTPTAIDGNQPFGVLEFQGVQCMPRSSGGLDKACFDGTFELTLQGRYSDPFGFGVLPFGEDAGAEPGLDLDGGHMTVRALFCEYLIGDERCPAMLPL